ncbi:MAG: NADH-quinone oxidoreductase subunit M [Gammaproteobacteria bacterium]|nr:NADH-quinone oxidoreductase subunit M [Gammaproteobacteria bacterium]
MPEAGLLSLIVWFPVVAGLLIAGLARSAAVARWSCLAVALLEWIPGFLLWRAFEPGGGYQFVERHDWIERFNVEYYLGIDGIALALILLTLLLTPAAVVAGWRAIDRRTGLYYGALLIQQGLMLGVFCALDSLLFYVFWEFMLAPMFLIIGIWGGERRIYATVKFFLFTFLGSVFMLVSLVYLYQKAGSYAIPDLHALPLTLAEQQFLFFGFLAAFAVKVPMWPVHTWLPDAHVEAPTGGSVILAAILLKMGGFGMLRFSLPVTPDAAYQFAPLIVALSLVAIVYIAFVALAQSDLKKLIAYSSVAHMGFVTLGMFVPMAYAGAGDEQLLALGMGGGMVQMISHGFISAALFMCVGVLYDRVHSRRINDFGGVANTMPVFAVLLVLFGLANAGLPGTSGFVGEFLVILASFRAQPLVALGAGTILVLGAAYSLYMIKRVVFGEVANEKVAALEDLDTRELIALGGMGLAVIVLGLYPDPLVEMMEPSLDELARQVLAGKVAAW